jgi:hypothetical protein
MIREPAQLELRKIKSMAGSIPLDDIATCGAHGIACCNEMFRSSGPRSAVSQAPKGIRRNEPHGAPGRQQ